MSVEVTLTIEDYHNLMNWYELAFAKRSTKDVGGNDRTTFRKLSVMAQTRIEELNESYDSLE